MFVRVLACLLLLAGTACAQTFSISKDTGAPVLSNITEPNVTTSNPLPAAFYRDLAQCNASCNWLCESPQCPAVCSPSCRKPKCQVMCEKQLPCPKCVSQCEQPQCTIQCPRTFCNKTGCAKCAIVCKPAKCHAFCDPPLPRCAVVCEPTNCTQSCRRPSSCELPKCALHCPAPSPLCAVYRNASLTLPSGTFIPRIVDLPSSAKTLSPVAAPAAAAAGAPAVSFAYPVPTGVASAPSPSAGTPAVSFAYPVPSSTNAASSAPASTAPTTSSSTPAVSFVSPAPAADAAAASAAASAAAPANSTGSTTRCCTCLSMTNLKNAVAQATANCAQSAVSNCVDAPKPSLLELFHTAYMTEQTATSDEQLFSQACCPCRW